ncbi:MAG: hypothetical protein IJJ45_00115 [Clostridia bacterium]|nr:hypothetical protein [Clostridia bacterium]
MMSLPGKLCIGLLEEDNPLRSYFRFKPLLIDVDGRYAPCGDLSFPQEGCLRIVPDKNESYHFKARMREIGLFCVVDLRQYPGESDKIRPNKNYRPDGEEINANIIYSDVVRAPARDMILQILSADAVDRLLPRPGSESVLLREADGVDPRRYGWEVVPGCDGEGRLVAGDAVCPLEEMQLFDMTGFRGETVSFAIRPASGMEKVSDMPDRQSPEEVKPEPPSVPVASASDPDAASRARPTPSPRVRAAEEKRAPKPDEPAATPGASVRMSRAEQLMAQQVGLNPRRGRSLQELIDEKWQQSRMNQLGQCVQDIATGAPVDSPVDTAVRAMREAWQSPALRGPLLSAICELDAMDRMLDAQREARKQAAVTEELDNLEAQKLQLMAELETLKAASEETRRKLRQEICREEDQALMRARSQTEAARAEAERMEQQAADARIAAQDAQALLEQLTGEQLERKIRDVALTRRVLERLDALKAGEDADSVPPVPERIDMEAMVGRVQRRFEAEGLPMTRAAAANFCVCLAVSPVLMLTGAPGSGKTVTARLLAEALGLGGRAVTPP